MATPERKTLSIKKPSYAAMFKAPNPVDIIEKNLKDTVMRIFQTHENIPAASYNERFALNAALMKQLFDSIQQAFQDLQSASRYPVQNMQAFKQVTQKVADHLSDQNLPAHKFSESLEKFLHPKDHLPKVGLDSFRR